MSKAKIFRTTGGGRLYFHTSDFFKQAEVQQMVKDLMASSLFKRIEQKKINRNRQMAECKS